MTNPYSQVEAYRDGDIVVRQGDEGREMYVVQSGRVRLAHVNGAGEPSERLVERGDFFGELSLFQALTRLETAYAVGETKLLVLEPGSLLLKIRRDPTLAFALLQRMSGRIVELEQQLRQRDAESTGFQDSAALRANASGEPASSAITRTNPRARP